MVSEICQINLCGRLVFDILMVQCTSVSCTSVSEGVWEGEEDVEVFEAIEGVKVCGVVVSSGSEAVLWLRKWQSQSVVVVGDVVWAAIFLFTRPVSDKSIG
jgi:hypothetical protein